MIRLIVSVLIFNNDNFDWFFEVDSGLIISIKIIVWVCVGCKKFWFKLEL